MAGEEKMTPDKFWLTAYISRDEYEHDKMLAEERRKLRDAAAFRRERGQNEKMNEHRALLEKISSKQDEIYEYMIQQKALDGERADTYKEFKEIAGWVKSIKRTAFIAGGTILFLLGAIGYLIRQFVWLPVMHLIIKDNGG